nr:MAG TPA: hypothetical protein [Caudoviricetes sp.]
MCRRGGGFAPSARDSGLSFNLRKSKPELP